MIGLVLSISYAGVKIAAGYPIQGTLVTATHLLFWWYVATSGALAAYWFGKAIRELAAAYRMGSFCASMGRRLGHSFLDSLIEFVLFVATLLVGAILATGAWYLGQAVNVPLGQPNKALLIGILVTAFGLLARSFVDYVKKQMREDGIIS